MLCPRCKGDKVKTNNLVDDSGDVQQTVCANELCGFILKEERIIESADGDKRFIPRRVKEADQPDWDGEILTESGDDIPSAQEMMSKAIRLREETIGKAAKDLVRTILEECAEPNVLLSGEHQYCISEEDSLPSEALSLAIKELRDRGYKPTKKPVPGEGTWINIKWPTKKTKPKRRKKQSPQSPQSQDKEVQFEVLVKGDKPARPAKKPKQTKPAKPKPTLGRDPEMIAKQREAAARRKKALQERSGSQE